MYLDVLLKKYNKASEDTSWMFLATKLKLIEYDQDGHHAEVEMEYDNGSTYRGKLSLESYLIDGQGKFTYPNGNYF